MQIATYSWQELAPRLRAFGAAVGVHLLMAALVVLGTMNWQPFRERQAIGLTIEAVIVDTSAIREQREQARQAQEMERRRDERAAELERQRQREAEQQLEQQRRQQQLEEQRKRDAADRLQQLRIERERKMEEERRRQQQELDRVRQQAAEAERKRKLEEERLKQLESQRQRQLEEQQRLQREAEAQRQAELAAQQQFQAGQAASKRDEYKYRIAQLVRSNWLRPPTANPGLNCTVKVVQIPGGEVISSSLVGRCNGDEATRRSILAAVDRAGALPYRGYEDVFEREIEFTFRYDGD